jgi:hypothetical protein
MTPHRLRLRTGLILALLHALAGAAPACAAPVDIHIPAPGSPQRQAILDGLRTALGVQSLFIVHHLRVAGDWAYFRGQPQGSKTEVAALLNRNARGLWQVRARLAGSDAAIYQEFTAAVRRDKDAHALPDALFPVTAPDCPDCW